MVATMESSNVHGPWRDLLAATAAGATGVVITQQGEPVLAVIDYADYLAIIDALEDASLARRAAAVLEDLDAGRTDTRPWAEVRTELMAAGALGE